MGKRKTAPAASSQGQLAATMDVSRKTVTEWVKRADWPVRRRAPWSWADVHKIREWRKGLSGAAERDADQPDNADNADGGNGILKALQDSPERLAKLRLQLVRREILELDRAIKAGEYVKLAEVEAGRVARIQAVKTMLLNQRQRVEIRVRTVVKNEKTIAKIGKIIDAEARRILKTFAGQDPEADD